MRSPGSTAERQALELHRDALGRGWHVVDRQHNVLAIAQEHAFGRHLTHSQLRPLQIDQDGHGFAGLLGGDPDVRDVLEREPHAFHETY